MCKCLYAFLSSVICFVKLDIGIDNRQYVGKKLYRAKTPTLNKTVMLYTYALQ